MHFQIWRKAKCVTTNLWFFLAALIKHIHAVQLISFVRRKGQVCIFAIFKKSHLMFYLKLYSAGGSLLLWNRSNPISWELLFPVTAGIGLSNCVRLFDNTVVPRQSGAQTYTVWLLILDFACPAVDTCNFRLINFKLINLSDNFTCYAVLKCIKTTFKWTIFRLFKHL